VNLVPLGAVGDALWVRQGTMRAPRMRLSQAWCLGTDRLPLSLGPRLLSTLLECRALSANAPQLHARLQVSWVWVHSGICLSVCLSVCLPAIAVLLAGAGPLSMCGFSPHCIPFCPITPLQLGCMHRTADGRRASSLMQAELDALQRRQLHTEKAYDHVKSGSLLGLFGLPAFTSDGKRSRSQVTTVTQPLQGLRARHGHWIYPFRGRSRTRAMPSRA
jgi:hypothetical protein